MKAKFVSQFNISFLRKLHKMENEETNYSVLNAFVQYN